MKKRAHEPLAGPIETTFNTQTPQSIGEAARGSTGMVGHPGASSEVQSGVEERARCQLRGGAELSLDPERSRYDKSAVAEVDTLGATLERERNRETELVDQVAEAERERAALQHPGSAITAGFVVGSQLLMSTIFAVATALLITSSLDAFLLRAYAVSIFGDAGPQVAVIVAALLALGLALALHLGQSVAVVARRGAVTWWLKAIFVGSDLLFAGAFGMLRLSHKFSWQALSLTLVETAVLLCHTGAVLAFASIYATAHERRVRYAPADAKVAAIARHLEQCRERIEDCREQLSAQLALVGKRELGARCAQSHAELAVATARLGHLESAGALAGTFADNPSADAMTGVVDGHLATRVARSQKGKA